MHKAEYATLCGGERTVVDDPNTPPRVRDHEWVNCCITWVKKTGNGDLYRWLQPKIVPAWPELNTVHRNMFRGASVFVFRLAFVNGPPCRFFSLICFDWIATKDGQTIPRQVLEWINKKGQDTFVSWVFVPQHNSEPCHPSFLRRGC